MIKYEHPDFEIQFLTPEKGRGKTPPCYEIKKLNVNAEGLRFIEILQKYKMSMTYDNIVIQLPEPEAYALHKILISQKRKDDAKKEKDLRAGIAIFPPGDIRYNEVNDDSCLWRKTSFAFHLIRQAINLPQSLEGCVSNWKEISKDLADPPRKRMRQISAAFS